MSRNIFGFVGRTVASVKSGIAIRKAVMEKEKSYFASEESDPERLEAQKQRDQEFIQSLKKLGVAVLVFLVFYAILRTILNLW
ncbi:hypothetical protein [Streptococcus danieliae]|uniref:Uncharacterized protein n=1 Tax=Streptococcus danieliae TaxID=747656 RepID=A0A7Z0S4Y4_9STRE|nr:hypothetical protein [Streptococcus danieliae]MBF0699503.1 hypothetical protein [Streptococcus danieliae]NYS96679.1 hypothetical protein [Streptococcus danieliae]